ncbi:hypothetical protein ABIA30_004010 [Mycobacterium sp. MAA66]|uniref:hypothetical protein n=1 Tax=Mycobacterium sp. MAA66 TaxID=3156297 RepID=UPI003514C1BB
MGGGTERLQQSSAALQQAGTRINAVAATQYHAAASPTTVIDQLSASPDPLAGRAAGTSRSALDPVGVGGWDHFAKLTRPRGGVQQ